MKSFGEILEEAKTLDLQDKEELVQILDKIIADERREEIYQNYQNSLKSDTDRQYTNNIHELRKRLS